MLLLRESTRWMTFTERSRGSRKSSREVVMRKGVMAALPAASVQPSARNVAKEVKAQRGGEATLKSRLLVVQIVVQRAYQVTRYS